MVTKAIILAVVDENDRLRRLSVVQLPGNSGATAECPQSRTRATLAPSRLFSHLSRTVHHPEAEIPSQSGWCSWPICWSCKFLRIQ
jgi:hypothetical protein